MTGARLARLTEVADIARRRADLDHLEREAIDAARAAGATWAEIADALGLRSRQAAEQRRIRLDTPDARRHQRPAVPTRTTQTRTLPTRTGPALPRNLDSPDLSAPARSASGAVPPTDVDRGEPKPGRQARRGERRRQRSVDNPQQRLDDLGAAAAELTTELDEHPGPAHPARTLALNTLRAADDTLPGALVDLLRLALADLATAGYDTPRARRAHAALDVILSRSGSRQG